MLYHLSDENHDGEVWSPRIPHSIVECAWDGETEDMIHKRICFSKTKSGAFYAINFDGHEEELYLHTPVNSNIKYTVPTEDQVPDAHYTHEVWVNRKVKLKCIAKVRLSYDIVRNYAMSNRKKPKVKIQYLEKYT